MREPSEPIVIVFARLRMEWWLMWQKIGEDLMHRAFKNWIVAASAVEEWEHDRPGMNEGPWT